MDHKADILLQAEGLSFESTMRGTCPTCGSSEKFYITRMFDGRLAYICHRARACGNKGWVDDASADHSYAVPGGAKAKIIPFRGELRDPFDDEIELLTDRFTLLPADGISNHLCRIADEHYWGLRVQGPQYEHRGWVIRKPWWPSEADRGEHKIIPKARTFRDGPDYPMMAWYGRPGAGNLYHLKGTVIVEDQMSAITVAQNTDYNAVALLGTTFNVDRAREIQKYGGVSIILALDADVTELAFDIAQKYGSAFRSFRVALIAKDPKDMDLPELHEVFA